MKAEPITRFRNLSKPVRGYDPNGVKHTSPGQRPGLVVQTARAL